MVTAKVVVRAAVLGAVCVVVPLAALLVSSEPSRDGAGLALLAGAAALIAAYALFWFALAVLVDASTRTSALGALVLVSTWVAGSRSVEPSALARRARHRDAHHHGSEPHPFRRRVRQRLPPRPRPGAAAAQGWPSRRAEWLRAFFQASRELDARLELALLAFDTQFAGQQELVDRLDARRALARHRVG